MRIENQSLVLAIKSPLLKYESSFKKELMECEGGNHIGEVSKVNNLAG